ncbi:MAG: hypothetical protein FJY77_04830 [Candidatus Altiarchaeales archaeon]|nr:hypothetical protein [Candidatus Altiarchaeales archaeon]
MVLISGCISITPTTTTTTTTTTLVGVSSGVSGFVEAGCAVQRPYADSDYYLLNCSKLGLEEKYSCHSITEASAYLSGLSPSVPLVECQFIKKDWDSDEGIMHKGCMLPAFNRYLVLVDGKTTALSTTQEFAQFFAPVETREEALAFATALTNSYPLYNTTLPEGYRVFVSEIKPTNVEETDEGFVVHLFDYQFCGCGPHTTYAVDYLVSGEGNVTEISGERIYEDPALDGLCVD